MQGKIDLNDAVVSPFFVLASGVASGLFSLTLFGWDFSADLFVMGSGTGAVGISTANIIALVALAVAYVTNKPRIDEMQLVETWTAIATAGLVVAPPLMPMVESLIQSSALAGLVALIVQAGGFYALSYQG